MQVYFNKFFGDFMLRCTFKEWILVEIIGDTPMRLTSRVSWALV